MKRGRSQRRPCHPSEKRDEHHRLSRRTGDTCPSSRNPATPPLNSTAAGNARDLRHRVSTEGSQLHQVSRRGSLKCTTEGAEKLNGLPGSELIVKVRKLRNQNIPTSPTMAVSTRAKAKTQGRKASANNIASSRTDQNETSRSFHRGDRSASLDRRRRSDSRDKSRTTRIYQRGRSRSRPSLDVAAKPNPERSEMVRNRKQTNNVQRQRRSKSHDRSRRGRAHAEEQKLENGGFRRERGERSLSLERLLPGVIAAGYASKAVKSSRSSSRYPSRPHENWHIPPRSGQREQVVEVGPPKMGNIASPLGSSARNPVNDYRHSSKVPDELIQIAKGKRVEGANRDTSLKEGGDQSLSKNGDGHRYRHHGVRQLICHKAHIE